MISTLKREFERHGLLPSLAALALRGISRVFFVKVLKGVVVETPDQSFLNCDAAYVGQFLSSATLWSLSTHPEYDIPADFLSAALAKGDECYGFVTNGELAAYGWYSHRPTEIDVPELDLAFDQHYVYMYKGFTLKKHRGQRLHAVGMTRALDAYRSRGYAGIVSYVEWTNFDSLKSCYRMGYRGFGNVYLVRVFGRFLSRAGHGCAQYAFRLVRRPTVEIGGAAEAVSEAS